MPVGDLAEYGEGLWESILEAQGGFYTRSALDVARTVVIDDFGVRATDFGLTMAQKDQLIANGAKATATYLSRRLPA